MSDSQVQPHDGTIEIRPLRDGDFDPMMAMVEASWRDAYDSYLPEAITKRTLARLNSLRGSLGKMSSDIPALALRSGEVIGTCWPYEPFFGSSLHIGMLYVHPEAQRCGVGSALLQSLKGWQDRARPFRVEVLRKNDNAISFYQKHGFSESRNWLHIETRLLTFRLTRPGAGESRRRFPALPFGTKP